MTPPEEGTAGRGRRRSHHACLTCRYLIHVDIVGILTVLTVMQEAEDPVSWGETSLLKLCPSQETMLLSALVQTGAE